MGDQRGLPFCFCLFCWRLEFIKSCMVPIKFQTRFIGNPFVSIPQHFSLNFEHKTSQSSTRTQNCFCQSLAYSAFIPILFAVNVRHLQTQHGYNFGPFPGIFFLQTYMEKQIDFSKSFEHCRKIVYQTRLQIRSLCCCHEAEI